MPYQNSWIHFSHFLFSSSSPSIPYHFFAFSRGWSAFPSEQNGTSCFSLDSSFIVQLPRFLFLPHVYCCRFYLFSLIFTLFMLAVARVWFDWIDFFSIMRWWIWDHLLIGEVLAVFLNFVYLFSLIWYLILVYQSSSCYILHFGYWRYQKLDHEMWIMQFVYLLCAIYLNLSLPLWKYSTNI